VEPGRERVEVFLGADNTAVVDQDERRIAANVPSRGDRAGFVGIITVPPSAPGDFTVRNRLLELFTLVEVVDSQDDKRPATQSLERGAQPWVDDLAPTTVLVAAEVKQDRLAAELREFHGTAVRILADDFRCKPADGEAVDLEQLALGDGREGIVRRDLAF